MTSTQAQIGRIGKAIGANKPAYVVVADGLRQMIVSGQLAPGDKLPDEGQLAELFLVGNSTIREAIRVLGAEGLVVVTRGAGGGTFVSRPRLDQVTEKLTVALEMLVGTEECPVDEMIEARILLESFAVRRAATRATPESLTRLAAALAAEQVAPGDMSQMFAVNREFHMAILDAAGNAVIRALAEPVFSSLGDRVSGPGTSPAWWDRVVAEHRAIADAVLAGNPDRADELVKAHLSCLVDFYENPASEPKAVDI